MTETTISGGYDVCSSHDIGRTVTGVPHVKKHVKALLAIKGGNAMAYDGLFHGREMNYRV